jgi:hypothetical protein
VAARVAAIHRREQKVLRDRPGKFVRQRQFMAASSKTVRAQARQPSASTFQASVPDTPAVPISTGLTPISVATSTRVRTDVPESLRRDMIERAAYLRAEQRGFAPGFELDDWLAAEAEVECIIRERYR